MAAESEKKPKAPGQTISNVALGFASASLVLLVGGALVIHADDGWFDCHHTAWNAVRYGAVGSAAAAALVTFVTGVVAAIRGRRMERFNGLFACLAVVVGWAVTFTLGQRLIVVTYVSVDVTDCYCSKPDDPHGVRRHFISGEGDAPDLPSWRR